MDTINHQVANNPDLIGNEVTTASDVASDIMNNQVSSYDISDLMSDEVQAECFRELVALWARREPRYSLISMCLDFKDSIENALTLAAKRNGYE